jgi:hypothetical protein
MRHKKPASQTSSTKSDRRRAPRTRGVPRWLSGRTDLDQVAQRRTLLILSVLSGHTPVTTAISEHGISRPLYYQLETKALVGMMRALVPGVNASANPDDATPLRQIVELEQKVTRLEQENRRLERLLLLARKVLPTGPVAYPEKRGRKPRRSTSSGNAPSHGSRKSATSKPATPTTSATPSIPTTAGASAP